MDTIKSLNLFFGQSPSEDFLEDLEILRKLPEKEIIKSINKTVKWYINKKTFEKEWGELTKNLKDEEKEEKLKPLRIIFSILKEFVSENVSEFELEEDFKTLKLSQTYIDHFLKKLKPVEKEFRKKALESERPFENALHNINWRIDKKTYRDGEENKVAIIELIHFSNGEKQVTQIELNIKALKHLISRLKQIEEEL